MRHFIKHFNTLDKTNLIICEVGVYYGKHAQQMVENLDFKEFHLVDKYFENNEMFKQARKAVDTKLGDDKRFIWHIGWSEEVSASIKDDYFDFVYIDANHGYKDVISDMVAWYPKVKKGGYLAGHDWAADSVQKAVKDFVKENKIKNLQYMNDPDGNHEDWYFRK